MRVLFLIFTRYLGMRLREVRDEVAGAVYNCERDVVIFSGGFGSVANGLAMQVCSLYVNSFGGENLKVREKLTTGLVGTWAFDFSIGNSLQTAIVRDGKIERGLVLGDLTEVNRVAGKHIARHAIFTYALHEEFGELGTPECQLFSDLLNHNVRDSIFVLRDCCSGVGQDEMVEYLSYAQKLMVPKNNQLIISVVSNRSGLPGFEFSGSGPGTYVPYLLETIKLASNRGSKLD